MNVYDFDNTIYDGESFVDFFFSYIKVKPAAAKMIPKVLFATVKYELGKITVQQVFSDYAPLIKKFICDYDKWEEFTVKFWDNHMHKIKSFYNEVRKDDDIILTASPELTIKEIASRLGIKNIVCSKVDYETGEITRLCMRQNKITALIEDFGEDLEIDDFYTDSLKNDGFFAKKAKRVFFVKGNKIRQIEI